eukprot:TRINITY_DN8865_c0_g1_i1.p1 TRINITY_DN8865_c0_g1~~TRINITY_DN8865_c0_g1_i1.p1  ORF type:complete len:392 (-),score=113.34 TRINITY_DN8865_c0_g1_i1:27-1202(-)
MSKSSSEEKTTTTRVANSGNAFTVINSNPEHEEEEEVTQLFMGPNGPEVKRFKNVKWELWDAILDDDISKINEVIESDPSSVNFQYNNPLYQNQSSLMLAVRNQNKQIVEILIRGGVDPNLRDSSGKTALEFALEGQDMDIFRMIATCPRTNVNATNEESGLCVLHFIVQFGLRDLAELLYQQKANMNIHVVDKSMTPIITAMVYDKIDIALWLCSLPDVDISIPYKGISTICCAAAVGSEEMFDILLSKGGLLELGPYKTTPLHSASSAMHVGLCQKIAKKMEEQGMGLDTPNMELETPLLLGSGDYDLVQFFISKGANPCPVSKTGDTTLHRAAQAGSVRSICFFLDQGIDPNHKNENDITPIYSGSCVSCILFLNYIIRLFFVLMIFY